MKKKLTAEEKAQRRRYASKATKIEEAIEATNHSTLSEDRRGTIFCNLLFFADDDDAEVQEYARLGFQSALSGDVELAAYYAVEMSYSLWAPLRQAERRRADFIAKQSDGGRKSGEWRRMLAKMGRASNMHEASSVLLKLESINAVKYHSLKDIAKESGVSYDQLRRIGRKAIAEHATKLNLRK